jgi:hypothetical protein
MTCGDISGYDSAAGTAELILKRYTGKDRIKFGQVQYPGLFTPLEHESKKSHQNNPNSKYKINGGNEPEMFKVHAHQTIAIGYIGPVQGTKVVDNQCHLDLFPANYLLTRHSLGTRCPSGYIYNI